MARAAREALGADHGQQDQDGATDLRVPIDATARIQTVDSTSGEFCRVLESFFALTGVPIVMNTSFNGPGEPIVESPADALRFLVNSQMDALYIGGKRVTRKA